MDIELGQMPDGTIIVMSSTNFRCNICSVEYDKERKTLTLHYDDPAYESLTSYELANVSEEALADQKSVMIIESSPHKKFHGYDVPLVSNDP